MESALQSNTLTNLISFTTNGNPVVSSENFNLALLDENTNLIVYSEETSAIILLEQRASKARLTLLETEQDADDLLASSLLEKAICEEDDDEDDTLISFTFDAADIRKLFDTDDVLLKLVETLDLFNKDEVDSERFLKMVLDLKAVFSLDYIFEKLSTMTAEEINQLMNSSNLLGEFTSVVEEYDDDDEY